MIVSRQSKDTNKIELKSLLNQAPSRFSLLFGHCRFPRILACPPRLCLRFSLFAWRQSSTGSRRQNKREDKKVYKFFVTNAYIIQKLTYFRNLLKTFLMFVLRLYHADSKLSACVGRRTHTQPQQFHTRM